MLESMAVEHERDGTAWRGEWKALPESCLLMGGFLMSERVMFELSEKIGKQTAHELVYEASMRGLEQGMTFEAALMQNERVRAAFSVTELRAVLDPVNYIGHAPQIVDRVLERARGWLAVP